MKIIKILYILLISGCTASGHGQSLESEFQFILKNSNQDPIKDIGVSCFGNSGNNTISHILAEGINSDKPISDENGLLILKRASTEIYGSYRYIGSLKFASSSTPLEITCNLIYQGASVYKLELRESSPPTVITLNI